MEAAMFGTWWMFSGGIIIPGWEKHTEIHRYSKQTHVWKFRRTFNETNKLFF
jgi:hypothetical protein